MRDDVLHFDLRGSVLERVRVRAKETGVSEKEIVEGVLEEALPAVEATTILAMVGVEEVDDLTLEREPGEDDESFDARRKLYGNLFGVR